MPPNEKPTLAGDGFSPPGEQASDPVDVQAPAQAEQPSAAGPATLSRDPTFQPPGAKWVVVHSNDAGHYFATRITARDELTAGNAVISHHAHNSFSHVYADDGQETVDYRPTPTDDAIPLTVRSLDEEP